MTADLQMARGDIEGGYNLAVGEPVLIQFHVRFPPLELAGGYYKYPTMDGDPYLIEELRRFHEGEIVIANGAKQALAAAFYAARKSLGKGEVYHKAPYWPSYPTLARMSGLPFSQDEGEDWLQAKCETAPNNPDGAQASGGHPLIWDAVYAHWVYGWDTRRPPCLASVHSASKLLGLSGIRVGWLVTQNKEFADEARKFVELTTSGVSEVSQAFATNALKRLREEPRYYARAYGDARRAMLENGAKFVEHLGHICETVEGLPATGRGMFAWFKVLPGQVFNFEDALRQAKVAVVTGPACGYPEGWYRMNMCQHKDYTDRALRTIKSYL